MAVGVALMVGVGAGVDVGAGVGVAVGSGVGVGEDVGAGVGLGVGDGFDFLKLAGLGGSVSEAPADPTLTVIVAHKPIARLTTRLRANECNPSGFPFFMPPPHRLEFLPRLDAHAEERQLLPDANDRLCRAAVLSHSARSTRSRVGQVK